MNLSVYRLLFLVCISLCCCSGVVFAQTVFEGQVIDKSTQLPVPFATITLVKARAATRTNEQGAFKLTVASSAEKDSLLVTSVGYEAFRMAVSAYKWGMFINLAPSATKLKEVMVGNKKTRTKVLDAFRPEDLEQTNFLGFDFLYPVPLQGVQMFAKGFKAPDVGARVTSISLGRWQPEPALRTVAGTNCKFRVHLMTAKASEQGGPDSILFSKDVSLKDRSRKVTINLDGAQVLLPSRTFFVVIEWLHVPYNEYILKAGFVRLVTDKQIHYNDGYDRVIYQPILAKFLQSSSQTYWHKQSGIWKKIKQDKFELGLSATVIY